MSCSLGSCSGSYSYYFHRLLEISKGSYGTVYYGLKHDPIEDSWELVAVKKFTKIKKVEDLKNTEKEIQALRKTKHKNVVHVYDFLMKEILEPGDKFPSVFLILELCNRGNLEDFVQNNDLSELEIRYLFRQMAEGLYHIHSGTGFVHRDIKPSNILLKDDPEIKIADFGEARELKNGEVAGTMKGTLGFINPQILNGETYTHKGDVFSLGVTLYFLFYKRTPWRKPIFLSEKETLKDYKEFLLNNEKFDAIFEKSPDVYISLAAKNLIKNMIQFEEGDRYDMTQVMKHPFLRFDKDSIRTPKVIRPMKIEPFLQNSEIPIDKRYKRMIDQEVKKQKVREIMEWIHYEHEKVCFLHHCMNSVYNLSSEFPTKGVFYGLLLALSRLMDAKSNALLRFLNEKKKHLFFKPENWTQFYFSSYSNPSTERIEKCYKMAHGNLKNLLEKLSLHSQRLDENVKPLLRQNYKPNLTFFNIFQEVILSSLQSLQPKLQDPNLKPKLVVLMYELLMLLTMNQTLKYTQTRPFVNLEKWYEDKNLERNVKMMKERLKIFYSNFFPINENLKNSKN